jgi:hypothetical protein
VEKDDMESREGSNVQENGLADQIMDSMGVDEGSNAGQEVGMHEEHSDQSEGKPSDATLSVQKRLKSQKRAHEREVRDLHARIGDLEARMSQPNASHEQAVNPYQPAQQVGSVEEHIHKAVSYALQHKEMEERKARDAQGQMHVHKQYQEFQKHLDNMGDKYDDFHDVVLGRDTPYTGAMRDYALTLPRSGAGSAGEVLYKLGQNLSDLERISKLHPLDQASEMAKLSHALISGGEQKSAHSSRPLGQIKSNPVTNSHAVTDKTPVGSIRQRMKSGTWK